MKTIEPKEISTDEFVELIRAAGGMKRLVCFDTGIADSYLFPATAEGREFLVQQNIDTGKLLKLDLFADHEA